MKIGLYSDISAKASSLITSKHAEIIVLNGATLNSKSVTRKLSVFFKEKCITKFKKNILFQSQSKTSKK